MAIQKVWNEELQTWIYDDPDLPEDLDFDSSDDIECNTLIGMTEEESARATWPIEILEERAKSYVREDIDKKY